MGSARMICSYRRLRLYRTDNKRIYRFIVTPLTTMMSSFSLACRSIRLFAQRVETTRVVASPLIDAGKLACKKRAIVYHRVDHDDARRMQIPLARANEDARRSRTPGTEFIVAASATAVAAALSVNAIAFV